VIVLVVIGIELDGEDKQEQSEIGFVYPFYGQHTVQSAIHKDLGSLSFLLCHGECRKRSLDLSEIQVQNEGELFGFVLCFGVGRKRLLSSAFGWHIRKLVFENSKYSWYDASL